MSAARNVSQNPAQVAQRWVATARERMAASPPPPAPNPSGAKDVMLRVLRGRHTGAEAEISSGRIAIGSSLDSDIVLTDRGVMPEHLVVDLVGKPGARTLTVSALAGGVLVAGEEVQSGAPRAFAMPLTIDIGDVGIQFVDPVPGERKALSMWTALPLAVAAGIGAGALGTWLTSSSTNTPQFPTPPRMAAPGPASAPTAPRLGVVNLANAARTMEQQLAAAGLDKQIKVKQRDNVLMAEGNLPLDAHPKWRAIKAAVRDSVSERLLIADLVKPIDTDEGPRNLIAAVSGGKNPSVTATNGKRAQIGEILSDGWVVRQITAEAILLERGGSRVTVKLTP
jgi:hypothetical protein